MGRQSSKAVRGTAALLMSAVLFASRADAQASSDPQHIVYWGNSITGASVRVLNTPQAEKKAEVQVKAIGGDGWQLLENSTIPGWGAALCEKQGQRIVFAIAHGHPSARDAITAAKAKMGGRGVFCSNALWQVHDSLPGEEPSLMDRAKGVVRRIAGPAGDRQQCIARLREMDKQIASEQGSFTNNWLDSREARQQRIRQCGGPINSFSGVRG